jgi:hypothetical protein
MRRCDVVARSEFVAVQLRRKWKNLRFEFAFRLKSLDELGKRIVHDFFDRPVSVISDPPHRFQHLLIEAIYRPPANAEGFNVLWPFSGECFHAIRCALFSR